RSRFAGFFVFQSFDSCKQGRGLFDLSRSHRSDARRITSPITADGVVSRVSSTSRKCGAREERYFRHGMARPRKSKRGWRAFGSGISDPGSECFDKLFNLSPVKWHKPLSRWERGWGEGLRVATGPLPGPLPAGDGKKLNE